MTILFMDGFENVEISKRIWTAYWDDAVSHPTGYMDIGLARRSSNDTTQAALPTIVNGDTITVALAYRPVTTVTAGVFLSLTENLGANGFAGTWSDSWVETSSAGAIGVKYASEATDWSADGMINADQWYHIEWKTERGTDGAYSLKVNGNLLVSGSGNNSGEGWAYVGCRGVGTADLDDVVIAMNHASDFGITKVNPLLPTSTGTGEWLGSDADSVDNHLLVDDSDKDSADYVASTAGADEVDLYGHAGAIAAGSTVHAIQAWAAANLDSAGTDDFSLVVESNATGALTARTLGEGAAAWMASDVQETDPDTATAWTVSGANAAQFGVRS